MTQHCLLSGRGVDCRNSVYNSKDKKNLPLEKKSGQSRLKDFFGMSRQSLSADPRGLIIFNIHAGGMSVALADGIHSGLGPSYHSSNISILQARIQKFAYDRLSLQYCTLVMRSCISFQYMQLQKNHPNSRTHRKNASQNQNVKIKIFLGSSL